MTSAKPAYITIGKIGSPYGIHGWLKILSYAEFGASILEYQPWYLSDPKQERTLMVVEDAKLHSKGIIAKFAGIDTPEDARLLSGRTLEVERALLPPLAENNYYWSDLIGLTVIDQHGVTLGTVSYLIETGSNDVIVIKTALGKQHAIPYLFGTVVQRVDLEQQKIYVNWELI